MKQLEMVRDPNPGGAPVMRIMPEIGNQHMITHAVFAPVGTHWRKATCEEVGCLAHHNGWSLDTTGVPADLVELAKRSGRRYAATRDEETGAEVLHFEAGQPCFKASEHRMRLDREEIFIRRAGDWRGNPNPGDKPQVFSGPDAFTDSLHTNLEQFED